MPPGAWLNLALAAVAVFYLIQVAADLYFHPLCQNLGVDYCAYWSTGKLVTAEGYASINDMSLLEKYQNPIFPHTGNPPIPIPFIYLPVFVLPFQLLSFFPLRPTSFSNLATPARGFLSISSFFFSNI